MTRSISERGAKTWRLMVFAFFGGEAATFRLTTAYIFRSLDEEIRALLCAMLSKPLPFFQTQIVAHSLKKRTEYKYT